VFCGWLPGNFFRVVETGSLEFFGNGVGQKLFRGE
jgi:hypothetical protein